jgi:hypothetical protein
MDVGQQNKVIVFKTNSATTLGAGKKDNYSTLLTTRGSMKMLNGNRGLSFGELAQNKQWEMVTRFQTGIESALSQSMKVEYDGRTFTIDRWEKIGEKRFYYRFILNEEVN